MIARAALACLLIVAAGCRGRSRQADSDSLVVISPHDEAIREEFTTGFERAEREAGRRGRLRWQPARGTGNITRLIESEFTRAGAGKSVGIDVMFGGGVPAFEKARKAGFLQPVDVDPAILGRIPERWGGVAFRDPGRTWYGATVNGFGILCNRRAHHERGWPEPSAWEDLADPRYAGLIELADATESGSAQAAYEMILEQHGWARGWPLLHRIAANAASFPRSSSDVVRDVSTGQALAGMSIDFYAYTQIDQTGPDVLGFKVPEGGTAFTPDPIAVLRGTPRLALATRFVEFVLSDRGQRLWALAPGSPGGPVKRALFRPPILPDLYDSGEKLVVRSNPFRDSGGFVLDEAKFQRRSRLIGPLLKVSCIQLEGLLRRAWKAVRDHPDDDRLAALFDALPFGEQEGLGHADALADPIEAERLEERWYRLFKSRYEEIVEASGAGHD